MSKPMHTNTSRLWEKTLSAVLEVSFFEDVTLMTVALLNTTHLPVKLLSLDFYITKSVLLLCDSLALNYIKFIFRKKCFQM